MLTETILRVLETKCHWDPTKPLVVGVSGGADSVALLCALNQAGARLVVGHFNHHLRATATRDADFVEELCQKWQLPFELGEAEVQFLAKTWGIGIEEAARRARYEFLFGMTRKHGAQAVVTAHHADDQVETILMHFMRGSGLDGLAGMSFRALLSSFDPQIPIFRPMLGVNKAEVLRYCTEQGLGFVEDETNQQNVALRNRLRNELIPLLDSYNPSFRATLLRNAQAIQSDQSLLLKLEQTAFEACLETQTRDGLTLKRASFLGLEEALQSRVIRHALKLIAPDLRDFGFELLQTMIEAIKSGQTFLPLTDNLSLWCIGDSIQILAADKVPLLSAYPQLMTLSRETWRKGTTFPLAEGWMLHREVIERSQYEELDQALKPDPLHAWLSFSEPDQDLMVRPASVGEAFTPLGMKDGRQKLSDLFINQKIPQPARLKWPLVTEGDSIVWVVGQRIAQAYRLKDADRLVLHLWAERATD